MADTKGEIMSEKSACRGGINKNKKATKQDSSQSLAEMWQTTFDAVKEAIWVLDTEWKVQYANKATSQIFGLDPQTIIGSKCYELVHGTKEPILNCPVRRVENNLQREVEELKIDERYIEITADPIINSDGSFQGVVHLASDITERRKSERALRLSENRFFNIFNSNPAPIAIAKANNDQLVQVNRAWEEITGYTTMEVIGKTPFDINLWVNPEKRKQIKKKLNKHGTIKEEEVRIRKKSGDTCDLLFSVEIIELEGEPYLLMMGQDITDKKKLEFRLQQSQKMEAIGTLAGGIAHDFNNILSSILGFAQIALGELNNAENLKDDLHEIVTAGMRAKDLVQQILTFARQTNEELTPVRVDLIANEVIKFIRSSIPTTIQINEVFESKSMIMGSPAKIHQIFMNLCTNSAHAMEDNGGILEISVKDRRLKNSAFERTQNLKPGDYIEIMVSDTGVGIPDQIVRSIFEPYFTTKGVREGTGMGLAVVHGIVESYGGDIRVKSTPGKGAKFTILLPVYRRSAPRYSACNEKEKLMRGSEKILFIDDETPIVKMGGRTLEQLGYTVTVMTESREALRLFSSKPDDFDMVITDMTMPEITGDKLAQELIKIRPDLPIILCTGYSKKISDKSLKDYGIKAVIQKPIIKNTFAKTVRQVLDESKIQDP